MGKKSGAVLLLVLVLAIAFFYWYFIMRAPCQPLGRCEIKSIDISCISNTDCYSGSIHGTCDINTLKCVNLLYDGNREECSRIGGEWVEWGC